MMYFDSMKRPHPKDPSVHLYLPAQSIACDHYINDIIEEYTRNKSVVDHT